MDAELQLMSEQMKIEKEEPQEKEKEKESMILDDFNYPSVIQNKNKIPFQNIKSEENNKNLNDSLEKMLEELNK